MPVTDIDPKPKTRLIGIIIALALSAAAAWLLLYHECADGGAMAGAYKTCGCMGIERVVLDQTEADGPRRSICIGRVTARTCYQYRDGPPIDCSALNLGQ